MYIPVLRTAQAELLALQSLSTRAIKKIKPYLIYRDTGERVSLSKFVNVIKDVFTNNGAFLEFPDHPNNTHYNSVDAQKRKFEELIEAGYNITPVVSGTEKEERRKQVRMAIELLRLKGEVGLKLTLGNKVQTYITYSIYDTSDDPSKLTIFIDFGRVRSKDEVLSKFPSYVAAFKGANVVFTGTVWGENQTEFEKGEITKVDNHLLIAWQELEQPPFYSDALTDNPNSYVPSSEDVKYMKIIPYFKWLALDGRDFLVVRASENKPELAKTIASELLSAYPNYFHHPGMCKGCDEIKEVADPVKVNVKSSPMTRKRMSFAHHMEVIASLLP